MQDPALVLVLPGMLSQGLPIWPSSGQLVVWGLGEPAGLGAEMGGRAITEATALSLLK